MSGGGETRWPKKIRLRRFPIGQNIGSKFFQNDFWGSIQPLLPSSNKPSSGMNIYKKDNELLVVISLPGLEKIEDAEVYVSYKTLEVKATINLNFKGFELVEEGLFQGQFQKQSHCRSPSKRTASKQHTITACCSSTCIDSSLTSRKRKLSSKKRIISPTSPKKEIPAFPKK